MASLVLSTSGLHLSVLVVRSKVRKAASSVKSKKTAEAKGEAVRGEKRKHRSSWRKRPSLLAGPARRGLVPELVADWPFLEKQQACLPWFPALQAYMCVFSTCFLEPQFSTGGGGGDSAPQGTFGKTWRHFWLT